MGLKGKLGVAVGETKILKQRDEYLGERLGLVRTESMSIGVTEDQDRGSKI